MKKSLLVLPLAALLLAGCNLIPSSGGSGKKKTSNTDNPTGDVSGSGQGQSGTTTGGGQTTGTPTPTAGPTVTSEAPSYPSEHDSSFASNMTAGEHTVTYDFGSDYATYKNDFPYVAEDTGKVGLHLGGMATVSNGCFVGSYNSSGYLMMKNKDNYASNNGLAFIGNCAALGTISSITITRGDSASTAQKYCVSFSSSFDDSPVTTGTTLEGTGDTATNDAAGMTFFKITTTDNSKNGQIKVLTITYTV